MGNPTYLIGTNIRNKVKVLGVHACMRACVPARLPACLPSSIYRSDCVYACAGVQTCTLIPAISESTLSSKLPEAMSGGGNILLGSRVNTSHLLWQPQ